MRAAIVLAVLSLALAGCLTPEAPEDAAVEGASVDAAGASASGSAAGASASANAASASGAATPAGAAGNATVPRAFPVSFEGTTGTYLCPPNGPGSITCLPAIADNEGTFTELEYEGAPTSASFTLTWEAASPVTAEMSIAIFAVRSCGDSCIEVTGDSFGARATGTSPLALDVPAIDLADDEFLYLSIGAQEPNPSQYPLYVGYSVDQPFAVEGVLNALVAAA